VWAQAKAGEGQGGEGQGRFPGSLGSGPRTMNAVAPHWGAWDVPGRPGDASLRPMLDRLHRRLGARLAAAVLALALSGVGAVGGAAQAEPHRCGCASRGTVHDCDCPLCHAAARPGSGQARPSGVQAARQANRQATAAGPATPPCHRRAASPGAPAQADATPHQAPRAPAGPCLRGTCGGEATRLLPPPATERYLLPVVAMPVRRPLHRALPLERGRPARREACPELPPPRAA